MRSRDSRTAKVGKQGRDDSIKQFSIETHPTHVDRYNQEFITIIAVYNFHRVSTATISQYEVGNQW